MTIVLLRAVAVLQLVLGALYLTVPHWLLARMGHSTPPPDLAYPLGMLAARFIAYGAGLWLAAREPQRHLLWIRLMALIQLIDLGVGLFHTATGTVPLALSAFPMFNAAWIAALCGWLGMRAQAMPPMAGVQAASVRS